MWEKSQYNVVCELEEPVEGIKLDRQLKKRNTPNQYKRRLTLMDLIAIFTDEADKVCKDKVVAHQIALESLRAYVKKNVRNIKIVL
jgi:hypothetical protein